MRYTDRVFTCLKYELEKHKQLGKKCNEKLISSLWELCINCQGGKIK